MSKRRGLQNRAADALKPLGFTAISGATFTRRVGEQLHFVGLQYGGFSKGFTFNLGCHFQGVPSLFDYKAVALDDMEELDSGLRCRVGHYIGDGLDTWWDSDNSEVPAALAQASWAIERAFDDCMKKWGDGTLLLQSHVKNRAGAIRLSRPLFHWMQPQSEFDRFGFVALLAHHHGDEALASALYEKALSCNHVPRDRDELTAALGMGRSKSRNQRRAVWPLVANQNVPPSRDHDHPTTQGRIP